ncbi:MAG TPA: cyclic nucleotide-binding domain-containing protein [Armatimonadota bacterium]
METLRPILEQHPFLKGLAPEYIELLTGCAANVRFKEGEYLFREGKKADQFFILRGGRVSLETYAPGRGTILIQTVGEDEVLGWSWLIRPYKWSFDGRALEMTRAISLDARCLRDKCAEDHNLGYEFMQRFADVMVQRLRATHLQLIDMYQGAPRK